MTNKKKWLITTIFIISIVLVISSCAQNKPKITETIERINYKLLNENNKNAVYTVINNDIVTFSLRITPYIKKEKPVLYTIFMNGKQIECKWNNEPAKIFKTTIYPDKIDDIKVTIENIPKGLNTFQFGNVYYPDKTNFNSSEKLLSSNYSISFHPFTIVNGEEDKWSENLEFKYNNILSTDSNNVASIEGDISTDKVKIYKSLFNNYNETRKLYYHWKNSEDKSVNARFSLLVNWEQVRWPETDKYFIETKADPGDSLIHEINISEFSGNKTNQIAIVVFINPDTSFWYFDEKVNDWEVNRYGSQAYSTLKNIIYYDNIIPTTPEKDSINNT